MECELYQNRCTSQLTNPIILRVQNTVADRNQAKCNGILMTSLFNKITRIAMFKIKIYKYKNFLN